MQLYSQADLDEELYQEDEELLSQLGVDSAEADVGITPEDVTHAFLERTSMLSPGEQAQLLGQVVEDNRFAERGRRGGSGLAGIASALRTGLSILNTGSQVVGQFATAFGGNNRTARQVATWANRIGWGANTAGSMLNMFNNRRVPALPGRRGASRGTTGRGPTSHGRPPRGRPTRPNRAPSRQPARRIQPRRPAPGPRAPARQVRSPGRPGGTQVNATAMLANLLSNPQIQQLLRNVAVGGQRARREAVLELPEPRGEVRVPLEDVLNAVGHLSAEAIGEMNSLTGNNESVLPEYLVGEDGEAVVDPTNSAERAAAVVHLFRINAELERQHALGWSAGASSGAEADEEDLDESEAFARAAGFEEWIG